MILIDTHTHLYLDDYKDDRAEMVQRALDQHVQYMLLPHIDSETTEAVHAMARQFPESCIPMMGLHPTSVKENYKEELQKVENHLKTGKYCAVGEVGIDLYWDTTFQIQQEEVFRRQIELAQLYDLPLVVHTRNSIEVALSIVKEGSRGRGVEGLKGRGVEGLKGRGVEGLKGRRVEGLRGVFHCYSGDIEQAEQLIELGYYLGIGGVVTYKNSLMAKVVEAIPLEYLVLETDAPFLTPVPKRGQRNESAYVYYIAQKIAEIKGISIEEVADITTCNAKKLFKLP